MANKKTTIKAKIKKTKRTKADVKSNVRKLISIKKATTTSLSTIKKLNITSVIISLGSAVAAYTLMSSAFVAITASYLAPNALENGNLQSAYSLFNDVSLQLLLIAILVLGAAKPLYDLTRGEQTYKKAITSNYVPKRFIDMAVQYALFAAVAAALLGLTDFVTIKLVAFVAILISLFTWLGEKYASSKEKALNKHAIDYNNLTIISITVLAVLLGLSLIFTFVNGQVWASGHIVLVWASLVVFMLLNTLNQRMSILGKKNFKDYKTVERNYLIIGMAARLNLAVILILGFLK